ncbi:protocadherin Fat 4-like [Mytilus californianus]|uniref:protocadherin Fat 4-like n=1 Tax=Mytilus californianus TaxID=6549 RepID=UPI00224660A0|nr:protocadherin Fat 4-like [Mytilus californianus]
MALIIFLIASELIFSSKAAGPVWTNLDHTISINENIAISTSIYQVNAADADVGDSLTYEQIPPDSKFNLSGQVVTIKFVPDYETDVNVYTLPFRVHDGSTTATATLTINVLDLNEATPVVSDASGNVDEGRPVGSTVSISISANDADTADVLSYSLSGTDADDFNIDSSTGAITTSSVFDREDTAIYTDLQLLVSDGLHTATASLSITINDINDNTPVFGSSYYLGTVTESSASASFIDTSQCSRFRHVSGGNISLTGTSVAAISASDSDDGTNAVITFNIASGDTSSKFSISGNDIVTTATAVDYEVEKSFTLIITATDQGSPANTGTTTVKISVTSVNEFPPIWTDATTLFTLAENAAVGTTIVTIAATDDDDGTDGDVTYEFGTISTRKYFDKFQNIYNMSAYDKHFSGISDSFEYFKFPASLSGGPTSGLFRLDSVNGALSTIGTFDYENSNGISFYDIVVKAKDGGSTIKSTERTISVELVDFNDNPPAFSASSFTASISEVATVGTSIIEFTVTDKDSSTSNTFNIVSGDTGGFFEFDANKLQLKSVIDLDTPTSASNTYPLQITVTDGGTPELTGAAHLTVFVSSSNEHTPTFPTSVISQTVAESALVGYTVTSLSATDNDYSEDGDIQYSIVSGNTDNSFRIDAAEGYLTLIKKLDYETTTSYVLHIKAEDGGTPANSATCTVSVTVSNENDNEPTCTTLSVITILETASVGDTVTTLSCNDQDGIGSLSFSTTVTRFSVDATSGQVTLANSVDYDSIDQSYAFDVTVSDGSHSTTVGVTVSITAVNEHTPSFTAVTETVAENLAVGTSITTFTATDIDYSPHDITSYTITAVSNSGSDKFSIDTSSGEVKLSQSLDYDTLTTKYYEITIVAEDGGGLKGTGTVTVSVTDVNDNAPACLHSLYVISLAEDTIPSTIINDLLCSDDDSSTNGDLTFTLTQSPGSMFSLMETGTVALNLTGTLNYETVTAYTLEVLVVDGGSSPLSTTVSIDITISDVNDGGPSFNATYNTSVIEDSNIETVVETVAATDPDHSNSTFGNLFYSILSGDTDSKFTIDSSTGQITLNGNLDRETTDYYLLVVQAKEQVGTYSASTTVNVSISDVNDNIPICIFMTFSSEIAESSASGTTLLTLNCSDIDTATYATLSYAIVSGNTSVFELSSNALLLKTAVNFESDITSYNLIIRVSDGTNLVNITGTITVTDVNEEVPEFISGEYTINVPENSTIGSTIATVTATDIDTTDVLTYTISSSTSYFSIDSSTGDILLTKELDREMADSHTLNVSVSDSMNSNFTTVSITVTDVNDNAPILNPISYRGTVSEEDLAAASVILTVAGTDADDILTDGNGNISFSIIDGDPTNDFQINVSSGELVTTKQLDYETTTSYSLVVRAFDRTGDSQSLSATAFITVSVTNVNEFDPVFNATYSSAIDEDIDVGTSILTVFTTDGDDGIAGDIYYSCTHTKFYVDSETGTLYLKDNLDYETATSYEVNITATDKGSPARNETTNTIIDVNDVNDNTPECSPSLYATVQEEDVAIGTTFVTLTCTDADNGDNGNLSYTITSVNNVAGSGSFTIDSNASVTTTSGLDFENTENYILVINVTDGGTVQRSTTVTVNVAVTDVNEHDPVFPSTTYQVSISEAITVGTVVQNISATDSDSADLVYYYFNSTNAAFDIDYVTGQVKVKSALDMEINPSYTIVVIALDSGTVNSSRSTSATIEITILDENEKPPIFLTNFYIVSLSENSSIGSSVVSLNATDSDNDNVTYSINSGNMYNLFTLNSTTGLLELNSSLDYENATSYTLIVQAEDTRGLSSTVTVEVVVVAYNEYSPVFSGNSSNVSVPENTTVGTTIMTLLAIDDDRGDDGIVQYSINSTTTQFAIESSSGAIKLTGVLDRETINEYFIDVFAVDSGTTPSSFTATYSLIVSVADVNDVTPICSSNAITHEIAEDSLISTNLVHLNCTDGDDDPNLINNQISYTISSGNTGSAFHLNNTTGDLSLSNVLDRETTSSYRLVLTVSDSGTPVLTTAVNVFITITDINDNFPQFTKSSYYFLVDENIALSSVVGQVFATDSDSSGAGLVYYTISSGNEEGKFAVDLLSGNIKVISSLDTEITNLYNVTINASDNGSPVQFGVTYVVITVNDVNDNSPSCLHSFISATVTENATYGDEVAQLTCSDNDDTSNLSYILLSTDQEFEMNATSGVLKLNNSLNAEITPSFELLINVTDMTYYTTVTVYVTVSDINEYTPVFSTSDSYNVTITEDFPIAGTIYTITASDNDYSNDTLVYSIVSGITSSEFTINSNTGILLLLKSLDAETTSQYTLEIEATDGVYSNSTNLTITVSDVNDNYPSCDQSVYTASFNENTTIGSTIVALNCSDIDISNTDLVYSITSGNADNIFEINATSGILSLNYSLDYENCTLYTLSISATDNGTPSRIIDIKVYINVIPINEEPPIFGSMEYNISVAEDLTLNSNIILVNASDSDTGNSHGTITYVIFFGDSTGQFAVDTLGQIKLVRQLDRETSDFYNLTILASDSSTSSADSMTSTAFVSIMISDVNDNYPKFSESSYSVSLMENTVIGATALSLSATDDDINENGKSGFLYFIISGNTGDTFNLSDNKLILAAEIDKETVSSFKLQIQVQDNGSISLSDNAYVNIEVLAVNEYTPAFANDSNSITVSETIPLGTILHTFAGTDQDTGDYGTLRYYIADNITYSEFLLDEYTGQLTVWSALDYDTAPTEYNLTVQVVDTGFNGSFSKADYMWLFINLTDENDHTPTFSQNVYTFTIQENTTSGSLIGSVVASDEDSGSNGEQTYYIVSGDGASVFSVNETSGEITTSSDIDYETKILYSIVMEAKDNGTSSLSSRCLVKIIITDINDNAPTFQPDNFAVNIAEDSVIGTSVTSMYAVDPDSAVSNNNVFTYNLISDTFTIDSATGMITTTTSLDTENITSYILNITAVDHGSPVLTGTATITVLIDDVNDNIPIIYGDYMSVVSEDSGINTVIATINATDHDDGKNAELKYSIVSGNTDNDFKLDSGFGILQVAKTLDRERTSSYDLLINVTDGGSTLKSTTVNVTITIFDLNDNGPTFTSVTFNFNTTEDAVVGLEVGTVTANDLDAGSNGEITYSLPIFWSGLNSHFQINDTTGVISTAAVLDRETYDSYTILCKIADNGSPTFTNTVNISITITDVNDNNPIFNDTVYSASFPENQAVGTTLIYVFAADVDIGVNKDITLTIDTSTTNGQTADTYIAIDSVSQTLTVKQNIDREITSLFQFTLLAKDGGTPSRFSNASISFIVEDLNDNAPSFSSSFYNAEIPYNDNCHVTVAVVSASDSDDGDIVTYNLATTEYSNIFSLNSTSGVISLVATPGENTKYELEIIASDTALTNSTVKVRVDTFESESAVVTLSLGISKTAFEPIEQTFISELDSVIQQNYSTSQTRRWCIKATSYSSLDVSVYVLENNATDSADNVPQNKTMLSAVVVKSLLTTSNGSVILSGGVWDQFNITGISSFTATITSTAGATDDQWITSTTGIAVLSIICVLVVVGVMLTVYLLRTSRKPKIKSEEEILKEKRLEMKVEEKDLEKPPDVKKQTMLIEIEDDLDDLKTVPATRQQSRIGSVFSNNSRRTHVSTDLPKGTQVSAKRPFRNQMSAPKSDIKLENVDKFYDEIDKSKLPPPVIVRGPMPKIDRKTHYKDNDFWNDMALPNVTGFNGFSKAKKTEHNKVGRPIVTRVYDEASRQIVEIDYKTGTKKYITDN